jgi:hypothetical protein
MNNTYRITRAKTGNKIHRSHVGSSKSDCGVRAFDVRCTNAQLVAHAPVICERCFSQLAVQIGLSISDAFRALVK